LGLRAIFESALLKAAPLRKLLSIENLLEDHSIQIQDGVNNLVEGAMNISLQVLSLFIIALPIASIAWTITHEEVVREFRDVCLARSRTCRSIYERKFFYLFTCEYCFSHYVTAVFLVITRFKLLFPDWRGYLIAGFSLVFVANVYMTLFARIRLELRKERVEITSQEAALPESK
jgi:hypothetical protein